MLLLMTPNLINLLINMDTGMGMGKGMGTDMEPHKTIQLNIFNKDKS
jgi:hypothetical protein